jgi:hypothetical protein
MQKLLFFVLILSCQFSAAAESQLPTQDPDQQANPEASQVLIEEADELIAAEITETNDVEEESSVRFVPTEEISQDLGVSFPIDI